MASYLADGLLLDQVTGLTPINWSDRSAKPIWNSKIKLPVNRRFRCWHWAHPSPPSEAPKLSATESRPLGVEQRACHYEGPLIVLEGIRIRTRPRYPLAQTMNPIILARTRSSQLPASPITLEIHKPIKLKSPIQRVMVVTSDEGVDQLISSPQLSTNILKLLVGALLLPRKWFDRFGTPTEARPPLPDTTSYPTPTLSPLSIITIDYQSGKVINGEGINQRGTSLDTTSSLPEVLCRGFTNAWNAGLGFNRFRPPLWE